MAIEQFRDCAFCGKAFQVTAKHPNTKTCSRQCAGLAKKILHDKTCETCGTTFRPKRASTRFCSSKCFGQAHRTQEGLSYSREYSIWAKMLRRCYEESNDNYRYYGGVGTYVCQRWRESVAAFIEDVGIAPTAKHTLDRIDTFGNYTCGKCEECRQRQQPANCRWATKEVQSRNQKSNRYYTHDGKTLILKDWARLTGIKYLTLWNRLNIGMPFSDAIAIGHYDRKAITRSKESPPSE